MRLKLWLKCHRCLVWLSDLCLVQTGRCWCIRYRIIRASFDTCSFALLWRVSDLPLRRALFWFVWFSYRQCSGWHRDIKIWTGDADLLTDFPPNNSFPFLSLWKGDEGRTVPCRSRQLQSACLSCCCVVFLVTMSPVHSASMSQEHTLWLVEFRFPNSLCTRHVELVQCTAADTSTPPQKHMSKLHQILCFDGIRSEQGIRNLWGTGLCFIHVEKLHEARQLH